MTKSFLLKRTVAVVFVMLSCLVVTAHSTVFGLTTAERNNLSTPFFDADCNLSQPSGGSSSPLPISGDIYVLGDSLTVGMRDFGGMATKLTASGWANVIDINAIGGKPLSWGVSEINSNRASLSGATALLVGLGTNDIGTIVGGDGSTDVNQAGVTAAKDQIEEIISVARTENPQIRVYWTDFYGKGTLTTRYGTFNLDAAYQALNGALREVAQLKNVIVIPWSTSAIARDYVPNNDVHPNGKYPEMADFIVGSLSNGTVPGAPQATGGNCVCGVGGSIVDSTLPESIPAVWRDLINNTAPLYPDADPRLVASVLWAENRGWPEFRTSGWGVSSAGAAGPWQFIESTWASMGHDGDGDGRKDRENPYDAVHAAFKHHAGSAGKPIAITGYSGTSAESDYETVVFERVDTNLLYYSAKYNGRGAPNGVKLVDFPRNENSDYVTINFWLLATNFQQGWNTRTRQPVSANGEPSDGAALTNSGCSGSAIVLDGFSFPVGPQRQSQNSGVPGMSPLPCGDGTNCHGGRGTGVAFDIGKLPGGDSTTGTPVYAVTSGVAKLVRSSYKGEVGCQSVQIHGDDTYWYANIHIQEVSVQENQRVVAGQQIAIIGERRCTGNGSDPHLHIDRGCTEGGVPQPGGSPSCRDAAFKEIMNGLFNALPE